MQTTTNTFRTELPYTHMLAEYQQALEKVMQRLPELRKELKLMQQNKAGTYASARRQKLLEQRIAALRLEQEDLEDAMKSIRGYAEREVL